MLLAELWQCGVFFQCIKELIKKVGRKISAYIDRRQMTSVSGLIILWNNLPETSGSTWSFLLSN